MTLIKSHLKFNKPDADLMSYTYQELKHALKTKEREQGRYPPIDLVVLSKKLESLDASLTIEHNPNEKHKVSGSLTFFSRAKGQIVTRDFYSVLELSTAISLGPVDIYWTGNVFIKLNRTVYQADILNHDYGKNSITVAVPDLNIEKYIHLCGAEKILCNDYEGHTAGQLQLKLKYEKDNEK